MKLALSIVLFAVIAVLVTASGYMNSYGGGYNNHQNSYRRRPTGRGRYGNSRRRYNAMTTDFATSTMSDVPTAPPTQAPVHAPAPAPSYHRGNRYGGHGGGSYGNTYGGYGGIVGRLGGRVLGLGGLFGRGKGGYNTVGYYGH